MAVWNLGRTELHGNEMTFDALVSATAAAALGMMPQDKLSSRAIAPQRIGRPVYKVHVGTCDVNESRRGRGCSGTYEFSRTPELDAGACEARRDGSIAPEGRVTPLLSIAGYEASGGHVRYPIPPASSLPWFSRCHPSPVPAPDALAEL